MRRGDCAWAPCTRRTVSAGTFAGLTPRRAPGHGRLRPARAVKLGSAGFWIPAAGFGGRDVRAFGAYPNTATCTARTAPGLPASWGSKSVRISGTRNLATESIFPCTQVYTTERTEMYTIRKIPPSRQAPKFGSRAYIGYRRTKGETFRTGQTGQNGPIRTSPIRT